MAKFSLSLVFSLLAALGSVSFADDPPRDPTGYPLKPFATLDEKKIWYRELLHDQDPDTRLQAAIWLGKVGDPSSCRVLEDYVAKVARHELDSLAYRDVIEALACVPTEGAVSLLVDHLASFPTWELLHACAKIGGDRVRPVLAKIARGDFKEGNPDYKVAAAAALVKQGEEEFIPIVEGALRSKSVRTRETAVACLSESAVTDERLIAAVVPLLLDEQSGTRSGAEKILVHQGPGLRSRLKSYVDGDNVPLALAIAKVLAVLGDSSGRTRCLEALKSSDPQSRALAVAALGRMRDPADIPLLAEAVLDEGVFRASSDICASRYSVFQEALEALVARRDEALPYLRRMLERDDKKVREQLSLVFEYIPNHAATPLLLKAAAKETTPFVRQRLVYACKLDSPARLVESMDELRALLNDPERDIRVWAAEVLARTKDARATRALLDRLPIEKEALSSLIYALGDLGYREAIPAIEAIPGHESGKCRALHKLAPDRFPRPIGDLFGDASCYAGVWDYDRMMALYGEAAEQVDRKMNRAPEIAVPDRCIIRALRGRGFHDPHSLELEIQKYGDRVEILCGHRKIGGLTSLEFERLWAIFHALRGAVDAGGLQEARSGLYATDVDYDLMVACSWEKAAVKGAWSWSGHYAGAFFESWEPEGLFEKLWMVVEGQRLKAKEPLTGMRCEALSARNGALECFVDRQSIAGEGAFRLRSPTSTESKNVAFLQSPSGASAMAARDRLSREDPWERFDAIVALAATGGPDDVGRLEKGCKDPCFWVREAAEYSTCRIRLRESRTEEREQVVRSLVDSGSWIVREVVVRHLIGEGKASLGTVRWLLEHRDPEVRLLGIHMSEELAAKEMITVLEEVAKRDPYMVRNRYPVRQKAEEAVRRLK